MIQLLLSTYHQQKCCRFFLFEQNVIIVLFVVVVESTIVSSKFIYNTSNCWNNNDFVAFCLFIKKVFSFILKRSFILFLKKIKIIIDKTIIDMKRKRTTSKIEIAVFEIYNEITDNFASKISRSDYSKKKFFRINECQ